MKIWRWLWHWFVPDQECNSIADINIFALLALGFRVFLTDIDNTLAKHNSLDIPLKIILWVKLAQLLGVEVILITYNFEGPFVDVIAAKLKCRIIKVRFPYLHRNMVKQAAAMAGVESSKIISINDFRIALAITRWFGCQKTILVDPIDLVAERNCRMSRFLRWIETKIIVPNLPPSHS